MRLISKYVSFLLVAMALLIAGCGDGHKDHDHKDHGHKDHDHKDESKTGGHAAHGPKFGGVLVELGNHAAHIEFNVDAVQKKVILYVWDAHVENAARIEQPSVQVAISGGEDLTLSAVENENTGEKLGDASTFACPIDKLAGKTSFKATVQSISIKGQTYRDIKITYPAPANK